MVSTPKSGIFVKPQSEIRFKDYLVILYRRRAVLLLAFFSVVVSTFLFVSRLQDVYESYSIIVIEQKTPVVQQVMSTVARPLSYYQGILYSRTFCELVLDSIGMDLFRTVFNNPTKEKMIQYIHDNITLQNTSYSMFLRLNCRARSRELAYFMATVATDVFQRQCREVETEESRRAVAEIEDQLKLIRQKLEKAESDFRTFRDHTGNVSEGVTPELKTLQEAYAENIAKLGLKEADLVAEKAQLSKLEQIITPAQLHNTPEVSKLRNKLRELEQERMRLESLGIQFSGISTIDREIKEIEKQLLHYSSASNTISSPNFGMIQQWQDLRKSVLSKETEMALFKRKLESYQKAINTYKKDNPDILNQSLELIKLQRSKEIYENIYNILLEKTEEQRIVSASSGSGIKIVDIAQKPDKPIPKKQTQYYLLGIILGLVLGLTLVFLMELNDTSLKSNEDIERYLQLSVLGTIPHVSIKKDDLHIRRRSASSRKQMTLTTYPRQLLNFQGNESISAEAFRSLRTYISFVSPDKPLQSLLLTSAGPSEGKSMTISNLAGSYAQMGKRTILIDADLRRPVIHHIFGLKREPGFTDLFVNDPDYSKVTQPTECENLSVISAGVFTPNPAELLASQKMAIHLDYFRSNYDMVFFDTPPIIAVTDAALLGTKLDGVLIVIRSHKTSREVAMHALAKLVSVGAHCVGVVLNDINLENRYASYGYYKYYYHSYKSKI